MSYNYIVHYGFEMPLSAVLPDDMRHGVGSIPINTDKKPETAEEFKEIARTIGKTGGYAKVAITHLEPTDKFVDDSGEILSGLVLDD